MAQGGNSIAKFLVVVFLCFVASFLGSWVFLSSGLVSNKNTIQTTTRVVTSEEKATNSAARKALPSVVSVTTTQVNSMGYMQTTSQGAGTGSIISEDGYILTNKHVVNGASQVAIVTNDGEIYRDVRVVGVDPLNDIAFLKVDNPKNFTPISIGNSSKIEIGQKVLAVGNALGEFQNSVTSGIISGEGRPITAGDGESNESLDNLLQTDAAINPGNSGGPLINLNGEIIGMNTAIAADAQGIGFAIPINATKGLIKGLKESGTVQRAYLGVSYVGITPAVAEQASLPVSQGAYVYSANGQSVVPGSPAEKAGVKNKDIITSVEGEQVDQNSGLSLLLAQYAPGDKVKLEVLSGSQKRTVEVTLVAYTDR